MDEDVIALRNKKKTQIKKNKKKHSKKVEEVIWVINEIKSEIIDNNGFMYNLDTMEKFDSELALTENEYAKKLEG